MPAARASPAPGVEQTVRFLNGPAGELFCSVHAPAAGAHASLVMCPPVLADHSFSYRRELLTALELARRGVAVWRFHYSGTGYSDGSPREISFDSILADARLVVHEARAASAAPVTVGGTRLGAMVAAAAAEDHPLVLWEPVADGSMYLREGFRARMIADGGQLERKPPTSAELIDELRRVGRIELLGYSLYEQLHDSIAARRLHDFFRAVDRRVLLIGSRTADDAEPGGNLAEELRELGADVTTATVGVAEGWWFHRTQQSDPTALAAELAAAIGPWLPQSEAAAAVEPPPDRGHRTCRFLDFGDGAVFGLLTPPSGTPRGAGVLLLWGGGGMPAFGRNRVAGSLARRLSALGYNVLQIDYPGRGDSPGAEPADPIDEPSKLAVFAATRAAYEWLRSCDLSRVVTIGSCQGAVAALNTADAASQLTGLALLAPPIAERFEAENANGAQCGTLSTMHPRMRLSFREAVRKETPLLLAYGIHDEGFQSFRAAMDGDLGALLRPAGDRVTLTLTEERIHGYMTVSGQEATIDIVEAWLERLSS
jgi:pimeloyl-ACP methyl ester carboxylesterase